MCGSIDLVFGRYVAITINLKFLPPPLGLDCWIGPAFSCSENLVESRERKGLSDHMLLALPLAFKKKPCLSPVFCGRCREGRGYSRDVVPSLPSFWLRKTAQWWLRFTEPETTSSACCELVVSETETNSEPRSPTSCVYAGRPRDAVLLPPLPPFVRRGVQPPSIRFARPAPRTITHCLCLASKFLTRTLVSIQSIPFLELNKRLAPRRALVLMAEVSQITQDRRPTSQARTASIWPLLHVARLAHGL